MWRIGTSTRVFWQYPVVKAIDSIASVGYEAVEIWAEHPQAMPRKLDKGQREAIKQAIGRHGLLVTLHATFRDLNLVSLNPLIRDESVKQVRESIELAHDLGARCVCVHPGRLTGSRDSLTEAWQLTFDVFQDLANSAMDLGTVLAVENMENRNQEFIVTPEDCVQLVNTIKKPNVGITLDIAHANTTGRLKDFVGKVAGAIVHIHLSDNTGAKPVHMPIGEGKIDILSVLTDLKRESYNGLIVIEGYQPDMVPERLAKKNLEEVMNLYNKLHDR